jgi:cytochrome c-type biogenesis protein CcmH/NrfF
MQAMLWWLLPLAAFVLAVVWVSVANRPRPRADPHDSVAEHERFRDAMRRQVESAPLEPGPDEAIDGDHPTTP